MCIWNFLNKLNTVPWCYISCVFKAWQKHSETNDTILLFTKQARGYFCVMPVGNEILYFCPLHANARVSTEEQVHTVKH